MDGKGTIARLMSEYGKYAVCRGEVLMAMDCLMHHITSEEDFEQWTQNALPDDMNWNIMDFDPDESAERSRRYAEAAAGMSKSEFECVVRTFADIVRAQCFRTRYLEGAFGYMDCMGVPRDPDSDEA